MKLSIDQLIASLLLAGATAFGQQVAAGEPLALWCIPLERLGCGCDVRITGLSCPNQSFPGQPHLFSELHEGAPLWLNIAGQDISLQSDRSSTNSFEPSRGASWNESYRSPDLSVKVSYRPGRNTCPKSKTEGCEFFDVAATVLITTADGRTTRYFGTGSCGC